MAKQDKQDKSKPKEATASLRESPPDLTKRGTQRKRKAKRSKAEIFAEEVKTRITAAKLMQEQEELSCLVFRQWISPEMVAMPMNWACTLLKKPLLTPEEANALANAAYPLGTDLLELFIAYGKYIRFGLVVGGIIIARVGKKVKSGEDTDKKNETEKET